ncbi:MAG: hypothetical protein HYR72_24295 [Deltaproteobacteria bacterium]|nr:hypothetical protein [Deltaproteobacteria bacterium]MBI3389223.1 hypothetical protein [Deltaproteobacteria bacterium]
MKSSTILMTLVAGLLSCSVALAHEGQTHIMGKIRSLNHTELMVATPDGATVSIRVNDRTGYEDASGKPTDARPEVGNRVVVDVTGERDSLTATQIRFSTANAHGEQETPSHQHDPETKP